MSPLRLMLRDAWTSVIARLHKPFSSIFSGFLVDLLELLPPAMISILAGLAFGGAIQESMSEMIAADNVQVGLQTFLMTILVVTFGKIGSAFFLGGR